MKRGIWVVKILGMIVIGFILVFAFVVATMYLWNWLVPVLFAGPIITFWQALGLLALSKILFSGFGRGSNHWRGRQSGPWRPYWKEKWNTMTPEERERFKEKMKNKWCHPRQASTEANSDRSTI